jgi:glycosyltransferase involved in cell wall biosynthesis
MVLQEAIAERIPVVATKVSGSEALIVRNNVGYVVSPGDVQAIVERTLDVLSSEALQAPLSMEAISGIAETEGHSIMVGQYERLYNEILAANAT